MYNKSYRSYLLVPKVLKFKFRYRSIKRNEKTIGKIPTTLVISQSISWSSVYIVLGFSVLIGVSLINSLSGLVR